MRKALIVFVSFIACLAAKAQVPYFAGTVGDGKVYGYTSLKVRPGIDQLE